VSQAEIACLAVLRAVVRGMPTLLEDKGYVRHKRDGMRYVYTPAIAPAKARQSALRQLVSTFFEEVAAGRRGCAIEMFDHKLNCRLRKEITCPR
jgi:BlaI family transcriptional regulator, penicillinase repressor